MNILFLTLIDFERIEERGIYTDLLRGFIKKDHKVHIISPTERRCKKKTEYREYEKYKLLKLKIGNIQKVNFVEKGISTVFVEALFTKAIKKYFNDVNFDLVIYSTPPITFEKVVNYVKKRDNAKTYLLLKDIFPQNAVDLKMFSKKTVLHKYFRNKEKRLYLLSDYVGCMSEANVEYLLSNNPYLDERKIHVSPNSIDPLDVTKNHSEKLQIREKYKIPLDSVVFLYGGNLGKPQGIDFFIECLKTQKNNIKAFFLVVGSGTEYQKLENYKMFSMQTNFKLISFLPKEDYDKLVTACDIGMIFLDKRFTIPNFPSRILSYMEASMPVLAATDKSTDLGKIMIEGDFGYWCESSDPNDFKKLIEDICEESASLMVKGKNARKYLEDNYTVQKSYEIIMKNVM